MEDVYIIGSGMTPVKNHWKLGIRDLAVQASLKAIEDAGNPRIDFVVVANALSGVINGQENLGALVTDYLGIVGVPSVKVEAAGASGAAAMVMASTLIKSGMAENVLLVGVEKMTDYTSLEDSNMAVTTSSEREYEAFFGATLESFHAMVMRSYMRKYGVEEEEFGSVPVLMHEHASTNPYAQFKFKLKSGAYMKSPYLSEPLKLLDAPSIGDGAAAVIVSSSPDSPNGSIKITSWGQATDHISLYMREELTHMPAVRLAAKTALEKAGLELKDISFFKIHDSSSVAALIEVEELGLVERGKATRLFESEDSRRGGSTPINPDGGLKARGHPMGATGVYQLAESHLQLTERAEGTQVKGAERALILSAGGLASNVVVHIVERV